MSLVLTSGDLLQLRSTLETLLSPLDYETDHAWMRACMRRARRLLIADHVHFSLPGPGWLSTIDEDAKREYLEYYHRFDVAPTIARRRHVEVSTYEHLAGREAFRGGEFYNDWVRPNRLFSNHGMTDVGLGTFNYLAVSHVSDGKDALVARGVELLHLLHPAYKSGIRTWSEQGKRRGALGTLMDAAHERLALCDEEGRVVYANRALRRTLAADSSSHRLERSIRSRARLLGAYFRSGGAPGLVPDSYSEHRIVTRRGAYRIRSSRVDRALLPPATVLVTLEPEFRVPLCDEELRQRYELTGREIQVARLIARGASNRELSDRLGISPHTARRHTEHIMEKLGVSSRAQVADRISDA